MRGAWHSFRKCLLNQPGKVADYACVFVLILLYVLKFKSV